jgi:hypothetical protein
MTNEKTGWLVKEGGSIKTWRKRWFILKNGEFSYYKNKSVSFTTNTNQYSANVKLIRMKLQ